MHPECRRRVLNIKIRPQQNSSEESCVLVKRPTSAGRIVNRMVRNMLILIGITMSVA